MAFEKIQTGQLRIGMHVKLRCSWWKHPFLTNEFKVTSINDLETIRKISKLTLFYDPDLSDPELVSERTSSSEEILTQTQPQDEVKKSDGEEYQPSHSVELQFSEKGSTEAKSAKKSEVSDLKLRGEDKTQRALAQRNRRDQLCRTEKAHKATLRKSKLALNKLSWGDPAGLESAQQVLANLGEMLAGGNTTMTLIELMNSGDQDDPLFFHALNTSVLSMMMGKELNLSADDLQVLGLGALAHDIGMVSLPLELRLTSGGFAKVGANVGIHIERGLQLVDRIPDFPEPSRAIIAQHHERLNGTGYPNRLLDSEISLLTKIVMIVDVYDDLCNNPEQSRNLTPAETLSYLYQNLSGKRQGELRDDLLVTLIKILGVYPPGTMVELSDSSIGVVINVDSENRTRPQVLMYSPNVPKDEAVIVDLAEVENLKIQRSLRPPQVKREILNFLSPQRMIGFFPSSAEILSSSTQPSLVGAT